MGKEYSQLSLDERCEIYRLHAGGKSPAEIGAAIGRDRTTIWRELRRNSGAKIGYKVEWAEIQTRARRRRRLYKLECSSALRDLVLDRLAMGWSPEQIVGRLEREHGRSPISHESIYRYVYWRVGFKEYLHQLLPRRKFRRGFRGRKGGSTVHFIPDRVSISERPAAVEKRRQPGHWEVDLMQFGKSGPSLLVACERKSRLVLFHRQASKAAAPLADALAGILGRFSPAKRRSITFDNGSEFRHHATVAKALKLQTFFCDPHSPWQKGSVENSIGRLRRALGRKSVADLDQEHLDEVALNYNLTPRKCLNFRTPAVVFLRTRLDLCVALEM